ncbi:AbrB/MazE/SpoVT family DNA-binding domain-containing protein (plasmid) [Aeromonas caviae]|jgi:antitoxin MazE|uniref:AbrB/MazE/SpoVT family DNA-binding domain-containing protein n=3 Tax=Aeromonas TaxID=642 RepID=A0AAX3NZ34_9GAMM|nr:MULTISPECIES: AbrB/MazE/SpoVT family DNA-binding domain-containing protein [Aeromonas]MCV3290357.1 AbrB/MazE/SpoVT family DNA-binding domain-containing protein [Aeromonas media]MDH1997677.1 AbrB/MazE/SpoVT family DNA-binding domain-containing protein [Aeromonas caviae]MDX7719294.1 AbrB/MazE/SpoVT family DNA-binding domain-containing protein [Aeromonas caviae]MXQ68957.1 AbrB/MazE/SpoVT family DNA-binding domain-containing protein [Aeromonas caviae]QSO25171.1 AbrB/MazE/SpoVT family DNA-bindin
MQSEIKRWGNSAAVRIPSKILAQANLDVSSPISIEVKAGKIVIGADVNTKRKVNLPFSEAFLLEGLDAHSAHADELAQPSITELGA